MGTLAPMSGEVRVSDPATMSQPIPVPRPGVHVVGVAIPVPAPHGPYLQSRRADFNDPMAWSIPAHVTILGPTELRPDDVPAFEAHLADVAAATRPFGLALRGTGTFRPVSDVVFVQVVRGAAECEELETRTRSGRWRRDLAFPYHPHVTVAHDVSPTDLDRAAQELSGYHLDVDVDAVWLFELGLDGHWRPRRSFALGEAGPGRPE